MLEEFQKDCQELRALTEFGIDKIRASGCEGGKIVSTASQDLRLVVENGEFTLSNSSDSKRLGLALFDHQRKGSASINMTAQTDLEEAIRQAKQLASFSIPDEFLTLATKDEAPTAPKLEKIFDESISQLTISDLKKAMEPTLEMFLSDERINLERFEMSISLNFHHLANTNGVTQEEYSSSIDWDYMGLACENDEVSGFDYDAGFSYESGGFEDKLMNEARSFQQRLLDNLHPQPAPSYHGLIVITPRALEDLLLETFFYHMSGGQIMDGKSKWEKSIGKQICSSNITIEDLPHDTTLDGATAYDSDGLPTRKQTLIKNGILQSHLLGCYTAKRLGKKSTAMAGGPFGLSVHAGSAPWSDLVNARNEIIVVDRFSGNVDPLTGDFSGVAKNSSLYRNGERIAPLSETMIAGNTFEIANAIAAVCQERENVSGEMHAPAMLIDRVSVSSKGD